MFYLIDHACHQMKNTSRKINLHGGVEKLDPNVSIPATWADHSNNDINSSQSKFKILYCKCMNSHKIEHKKFITDLKIICLLQLGLFFGKELTIFNSASPLKFETIYHFLQHVYTLSLHISLQNQSSNALWQNKVVFYIKNQNMF